VSGAAGVFMSYSVALASSKDLPAPYKPPKKQKKKKSTRKPAKKKKKKSGIFAPPTLEALPSLSRPLRNDPSRI